MLWELNLGLLEAHRPLLEEEGGWGLKLQFSQLFYASAFNLPWIFGVLLIVRAK